MKVANLGITSSNNRRHAFFTSPLFWGCFGSAYTKNNEEKKKRSMRENRREDRGKRERERESET